MDLKFEASDAALFERVVALARILRSAGGRVHLVGGCVRDALLGVDTNDFDLEVFGLAPSLVQSTLEQDYDLDLVGMAFGVLKLRGFPIDVALPRRESKRGLGHRGFAVASVPDLSEREAAARRDFTINAIAYDPLEERWIDPYGGIGDLDARVLRHTTSHFSEDPLRVLRGSQFIARFGLEAHPSTVALCRSMDMEGLAIDRVDGEWRKLLLKGVLPGAGLHFLDETDWIRFFPEIAELRGCQQDPEWHPEGDVFVHTAHVLDAFAEQRVGDRGEDLIVGLACLCHDLGKPVTTVLKNGRWRSPGHEPAGAQPTRSLLARLTREQQLTSDVVPLVEHHLKPRQLFDAQAGDSAVRRLANKVRLDRLVRVAQADANGRPPRAKEPDAAGAWLLDRARALELESRAPSPLIQGRHLLELGAVPGPNFGPILDRCFERQLEGEFADVKGGMAALREEMDRQERAVKREPLCLGEHPKR